MGEKRFFVKDFIKYCSPCFGCDRLMTFRIGLVPKHQTDWVVPDTSSSIMALITNQHLEVDLSVRYYNNLKMWIHFPDQKLVVSDQHRFAELISKTNLYLCGKCYRCQSEIISKFLDFQTFHKVVAPLTLRYETFHIKRQNKVYSIATNFLAKSSIGTLCTYTAPGNQQAPDSLVWEMALLPKYKLGTRQKLIDKLDSYAIFS